MFSSFFCKPASAAASFHIGVATLSVAQAEETYNGAKRLIKEYGDVKDGGYIKHVIMPDDFMADMDKTISRIEELADDPKIKVVVVCDALPGTAEAFSRIKEKRPDILCFAGEPQEDPSIITATADLAISVDDVTRGFLIIDTAKRLGAKTFVHISFPRHMSYELILRRRSIMEQACRDLGLKFVFLTAPDPTCDTDIKGAQKFITDKFPEWVKTYGKNTAFFCTNDAQTEPLIKQTAKYGCIMVEQDLPSPLMGYSGAFNIAEGYDSGNWPAIMKKVEKAVIAAGGKGRMGTWAYSYGWGTTCALAEYGKRIVEKQAKLYNLKDLWSCYDKYTPGASWNGRTYHDVSKNQKIDKFVMVYQDTYIFGHGYMKTTEVKVPEKYLKVR